MKILLVEDEEAIRTFIADALRAQLFVVDQVATGRIGLEQANAIEYDCIVLDVYLPDMTGVEFATELRSKKQTPIVVMSVEKDLAVKVKMLELCDDYLVKPFSPKELVARIHAVLRRGTKLADASVLQIGDLYMDTKQFVVMRGKKPITLRNKEFALLEYFMRHVGQVLSRGEILEAVWDMNANPMSNTVDAHIRLLRQKVDVGFEPQLIHTVSGRGYKLSE